MRAGLAIVVGIVAVIGPLAIAAAQPLVPDPERPGMTSATATTTIPVTAPGATDVMGAEPPTTASARPPVSLEAPIDATAYVCGPGDQFELHAWGRQNFRVRLAADLEGRAFIAKVGFVDIAGKTLSAVRAQIIKRVRANYPGLQVELTLAAPRRFVVHVVDNVKQPGALEAQATERVAAVLARAGGITTGSRRLITIRRASGAELTADLVRYELTGDTRWNPYVLDGDVIRVPHPRVQVAIEGAVRRPGTYELAVTSDLAELLELSGGLTSAAARTLPIKVVRRNERQQAVVSEVAYGAGGALPNHALRDDDAVIVRGAEQLQRSVMVIGAVIGGDSLDAAATSKRLPYVEGDSVLSIIERAGGIRAPGDLSRAYLARPSTTSVPDMIPLDLDALLVKRDFRADQPIKLGDTIVIPPMRHSILVEGAVARAGLYTYNPKFGVPEYIAHAGGRTRTAQAMDDVTLIAPSGATRPYRKGVKLSPGDAILVPERNFTRPEVVQILIAGGGLLLSAVAITLAATR